MSEPRKSGSDTVISLVSQWKGVYIRRIFFWHKSGTGQSIYPVPVSVLLTSTPSTQGQAGPLGRVGG